MTSTRIRLHRVRGTHYECGRQIGQLTRDAILQRIHGDYKCLSPLFDFVTTDEGRQLHDEFVEMIRRRFPWYWDEIRGLAEGSEIPLEQILVLNFYNETQTAYHLSKENKSTFDHSEKQIFNETGEKGCTTVLLNRQDTNVFALLHNEDHATSLFHSAYLLEADIQSSEYDNETRYSPREKFIAYCYAGSIPGNGFGANQFGFAFALNGLYPNYVGHARLPRQIVNRALIAVQNEQELDQLLNTSPVAFGFCVNGVFFNEKKYLLNYEVGPNPKVNNENYISKCRIVNDGLKENKFNDNCEVVFNYLVHYNHYERLNHLIIEQKSLESTFSRAKRGRELGELLTIGDGMNLLGDQENSSFPIFRVRSDIDVNTVTLCTAHFDFDSSKLFIYENNPKEQIEPSFVYNLIDLFVDDKISESND